MRVWPGLIFFVFLLGNTCYSQTLIQVEGQVLDKESGKPLQYAFVVNHRTQNGLFCDMQGRFSFNAYADDTLLISQTGYLIEKVFLSRYKNENPVILNLHLAMKPIQLRTFTVKAPKTYEQILHDLEQEERKRAVPGTPLADALSSPITYLYQQFSRQEQSKQKIAALRSESAKKELLKELFTRYLLAHIIELDENEIDDFIKFSHIGDLYRKFETEYDLVVFIKERFAAWKKYHGTED